MRTLTTVRDVIQAFGGNVGMASRFGINERCISNWVWRNSIPGGWHLRVLIEARRAGFDIAPSVFGLNDDEAFKLLTPSKGGTPQRASV